MAEPHSDHVAIGRVTLFGGSVRELITVDKAFLAAAIHDALAWCHEMDGTSKAAPGKVNDYDAALAVLEYEPRGLTTDEPAA